METELMLRIVDIKTNKKLFETISSNYEEMDLTRELFNEDYVSLKGSKGFVEHNSKCFEFINLETGNPCIEYLMEFLKKRV